MTINGRIVLLRQRLGMSQRVFGERIGRSTEYVNRLENGKTKLTEAIISAISIAFGISTSWLTEGVGELEVDSVGDRIKLARKTRDYTQEELAEEIHISRNSVSMIERGIIRPGDEIVDNLCNKLWIEKNWLLTGQGKMDRAELTELYELLKKDPVIRQHIRNFIDHLENKTKK